jgi:hypothetical protein
VNRWTQERVNRWTPCFFSQRVNRWAQERVNRWTQEL